jgi:hypothetical protein
MNKESKTLREFSLRLRSTRNDSFVIVYGYDMTRRNLGYYIRASINGGAFSSSKKTLQRVRTLNIDAINQLISITESRRFIDPVMKIKFLERSKNLIKALRKLYLRGIVINNRQYLPQREGILRKINYPVYYKRDVDYIRKSRVNIFTKILRRKYVPYSV